MKRGTYALVLSLESERKIAVGKLGRFIFPAGYYIYVGSARGGISQRVQRHLRGGGEGSGKKLRWHIDYLIQQAKVIEVWYTEDSQECLWASTASEMNQGQILISGFGSSDCRCPSHLIYFPLLPSFDVFQQMLGGQGYGLKKALPISFLSNC